MYKIIGKQLKEKIKMYRQARRSYKMRLTSLRELGKKHGYSHAYMKEIMLGKESKIKWIRDIGDNSIKRYE